MKRKSAWFVPGFVTFLVLIAIGLYTAGLHFFANYTGDSTAMKPISNCSQQGATHNVTIVNNQVLPATTIAKLCDKLVITNLDNTLRLMAFGPHDHHVPYDGIAEKVLAQNDSLTVTLDQAGTFTFHDHIHDSIIGTFTVNK